jgi:cytochrome P450
VLTRYEHVLAALHDSRLTKAGSYHERLDTISPQMRDRMEAYCRYTTSTLSFLDPPEHTRQRAIMVRALARDVVTGLAPSIEADVNAMVDAVVHRGEMDVMRDVATPLARRASCRLLGIPEGDVQPIAGLVEDLTRAFSNGDDAERLRRGADALPALIDYFTAHVREHSGTPADDAVTAMLRGGDSTEAELASLCVQILVGSIESIRQLVGVGLLTLLDANQAERLRESPEKVGAAIEETLRYDAITTVLRRVAQEDLSIGGATIRAGEPVLLLVAAANRDPDRFAEPDRLDVLRRPNPHLSFGAGLHYCPGAAMSRLTGAIAIKTLLRRLPGLHLAPNGVVWGDEINARGLQSLSVRFEPPTGL